MIARNARGFHLISFTPAVQADGPLVQRLLDEERLACTACGERPAVCIRGVYGDVALCQPCEDGVPLSVLESNFGEFPER